MAAFTITIPEGTVPADIFNYLKEISAKAPQLKPLFTAEFWTTHEVLSGALQTGMTEEQAKELIAEALKPVERTSVNRETSLVTSVKEAVQ